MRCCNLCVTRKVMQTRCQQPGDPECFLRGAFVGTSFRAASGKLLRCGSYGYAAPEIMLNTGRQLTFARLTSATLGCHSDTPTPWIFIPTG